MQRCVTNQFCVTTSEPGPKGDGAAAASVSPASLTVPCGTDGKVKTAVNSRSLSFSLRVGDTAATGVKAVQKSGTTLPTGVTLSSSAGGVTSISIATTATASGMAAGVTFTVTGTYDGRTFTAECTLALIGSVEGTGGADAIFVDLYDEYQMVPTDKSGKTLTEFSVATVERLYVGGVSVSHNAPTADSITAGGTTIAPVITASELGGYYVRWTIPEGTVLDDKYELTIRVVYGNKGFSAKLKVVTTKGGAYYQLYTQQAAMKFKRNADNTLSPDYGYLRMLVETYDGEEFDYIPLTTANLANFKIRYSTNGTMPETATAGKAWGSDSTDAGVSFVTESGSGARVMKVLSSTTASVICVALFTNDGTFYDHETIPIVTDGANGESIQGDTGHTGRWYYYAGVYDGTPAHYKMEEMQAPYVSVGSGSGAEFFMLDFGGTEPSSLPKQATKGPKEDGQTDWTKITGNKFAYYIGQAFFGEYAHFGSFIINGDWMISTHGVVYDSSGTAHTIDAGHSWSNYNQGNAYMAFDASYPNSSKPSANNFCPNFAVDGRTGHTYQNAAYVSGEIVAKGSNNYIQLQPGSLTAKIAGVVSGSEVITLGFNNYKGYLKLSYDAYNYTEIINEANGSSMGRSGLRASYTDLSVTPYAIKRMFVGVNGSGQACLMADSGMWPTSAASVSVGQAFVDGNGFLKIKLT